MDFGFDSGFSSTSNAFDNVGFGGGSNNNFYSQNSGFGSLNNAPDPFGSASAGGFDAAFGNTGDPFANTGSFGSTSNSDSLSFGGSGGDAFGFGTTPGTSSNTASSDPWNTTSSNGNNMDPFGTAGTAGLGTFDSGFGAGVQRHPKMNKWPMVTEFGNTIYGCAFFDRSHLVVGDASGDVHVVKTLSRKVSLKINNKSPVASLVCDPKTKAGVFIADGKGVVKQWDLGSQKFKEHGALGQCVAVERNRGFLAAGSWGNYCALKDVRQNSKPKKIPLPGKCHAIDTYGNYIFCGVNKDPGNVAVLIFDIRTQKRVKVHKIKKNEGMVRCVMHKDDRGGVIYATQNGFIGVHAGGNSQLRTIDLQATGLFGGDPYSNRQGDLMVNSIAISPSEDKYYFALANGRVVYMKKDGRIAAIKFKAQAPVSRIAFSHYHLAVCKSYNYWDGGAQKKANKHYPYNEVLLRTLKSAQGG